MQGDLFGEPARDAAQSQWFTPPWLARRLVSWVPPHARVLEPSAGAGNLVRALLRTSHPQVLIVAVERDPRWISTLRETGCHVIHTDFLTLDVTPFDMVIGNFPFEGNEHMLFTLKALAHAPVVAGIFPASFEYGIARDCDLWATKAAVTHRARLPERVDYGGDQSPSFDSVALRIIRREQSRRPGEQRQVFEEVWRPGDVS